MKTLLMHEGFVLGYGNDAEAALIMARNDLGVNDELNPEDVADRPDLTKTPDQPYFARATDRVVDYLTARGDTEPPLSVHGENVLAYLDLDLDAIYASVRREEDGTFWLYAGKVLLNEVFFASEGDDVDAEDWGYEPTGVTYNGVMTYESTRK